MITIITRIMIIIFFTFATIITIIIYYHYLCHNYHNLYLCQRPESRKSLSQFHQSRNHHLWTCNQLQVQKVVNCKFKKLLNKSLFNSNHTCCEFSKNLDFFEVEGVSAIVHLHQNISASQCGLLGGWVGG